MPTRIYLDHAATTPLRPEAKAAMEEGFALWANPSSPHAEGRKARAALEDARERIKTALGWDGELIFTSGASEALAIGLGRAKAERRIISAVEHDAVFRAAPGAEVVPMEDDEPSWDGLSRALKGEGRSVVAIQHVNSETGADFYRHTICPYLARVRAADGLLLVDCSQSAGLMDLPEADMLVVSAHKVGGPIGIGALLVRDFAMLEPSGGHERGYRHGTENLPGAMGFAAALESSIIRGFPLSEDAYSDWINWLVNDDCWLRMRRNCSHIYALTHPSISAQVLLIKLDAMGFAVSAGSACSSGSLKPSRVLKAFGIDEDTAARTIRVSLGWNTTPEELDAFVEAWTSLN